MLEFQHGFDPESKMIVINVKTNLLSKYYPNFKGLFDNADDLPNGTKIERVGESMASIIFPIPESASISVDKKSGTGSVALETGATENIYNTVNKFVNSAIRSELRKTEFLPLSGYPLEDLQNDVKAGVGAKRRFCILGSYQEYLDMQSEGKYEFTQAMIDYGTPEYADIAVMVMSGEMEELKKLMEPRLKKEDWF